MPVLKIHEEFHPLDMESGWRKIPGYPDGITEKVLAGTLDTGGKRGSRTRLLKFEPGAYTTVPFVHDYWEEVFMLSGDIAVGVDGEGRGGETFAPPTYAVRPPGVYHGPFRSDGGCVLLESHYYADPE